MYCTLGGIFIIIGSGLMSTFSETSKKGELIGYLLIAGIGIGKFLESLAETQGIKNFY